MGKKKIIRNEEGNAILWTMMFLAVFFLIASTIMVLTITDIRQSTKIDSSVEAYLLAESGLERARNYVSAQEPSGEVTGYINDDFYTFEVVEGSNTFSIGGDCDAQYDFCYYSESRIGDIKRKIEGESNLHLPEYAKFAHFNHPDFTQATLGDTITGTKSFKFDSSLPDSSIPFNPPSSPKNFTYIVNTFASVSFEISTDYYMFGIADSLNKGLAIKLDEGSNPGQLRASLVDMNGRGTGDEINYGNIDNIDTSEIRFELIYRKNSSTTLKIINTNTRECFGVITTDEYKPITPINPYYAYFDNGGVNKTGSSYSYVYVLDSSGISSLMVLSSFLRLE